MHNFYWTVDKFGWVRLIEYHQIGFSLRWSKFVLELSNNVTICAFEAIGSNQIENNLCVNLLRICDSILSDCNANVILYYATDRVVSSRISYTIFKRTIKPISPIHFTLVYALIGRKLFNRKRQINRGFKNCQKYTTRFQLFH